VTEKKGAACDAAPLQNFRPEDSRSTASIHTSTATAVLGADPGLSGALAFLYDDGRIEAFDTPVVANEIDADALVRIIRERAPRLAVVECGQSMPRQGLSSTFRYGVACGMLRAVIALSNVPYHLVSPVKWKRHFGLDSDKEKSRALAIRLWPGCGLFERVKDHNRAESALLAKYGADVIERFQR
jgi:hypothetical protein